MRELSAAEILGVWERGRGRTLPERALELVVAGGHPEPPELLSVGERDALLVELRELMFGPSLAAVGACPSCGELIEAELAAGDLRDHGVGPHPRAKCADGVGSDPTDEASRARELELEVDGRGVRFRAATAGDLVEVGGATDVEEGRAILLQRCVLDGELTPEVEEAVSAQMAEADPGAWIELALACPGCGSEWTAPFDIVSFLWAELDACARRLVRDVHGLASAYGWLESDVLALSAPRRAAYLELVSG
ncbi:MAG: hypothetical protein ABR521_02550 [Gaiellaceae bacterium]